MGYTPKPPCFTRIFQATPAFLGGWDAWAAAFDGHNRRRRIKISTKRDDIYMGVSKNRGTPKFKMDGL